MYVIFSQPSDSPPRWLTMLFFVILGLSQAVIDLSYEDYSVRQPWSTCSASRRPHDPSKMMLTALLPFGSLHCLWHRLHRILTHLDCPCASTSSCTPTDHHLMGGATGSASSPASSTDTSAATSLGLLADLALKSTTSSAGSPLGSAGDPMAESVRREVNQKAGSTGVLYLKGGDLEIFKAFQVNFSLKFAS